MRYPKIIISIAAVASFALVAAVQAATSGVTASEIKFGETMPYSGPASAFAGAGRVHAAYFKMLNDKGGIDGRKLDLISLDDAYSPPKTLEQTRKMVEREGVAFIFGSLGTTPNRAIAKYLNKRGVPQLLIGTTATGFADPKSQPWTLGSMPTGEIEAQIYAKYILQTKPNAKIGVLYANDDVGATYLAALKEGLGDKAKNLIVAEASYELTDASVDSQIIALKAKGADVLFDTAHPKFVVQAIRKVSDLEWKPLHIVVNTSSSIGMTLQPAGLDRSTGIVSAQYLKDPSDPQWADDPAMKQWLDFMKQYDPQGNTKDYMMVLATTQAQLLEHILKTAGTDLSRENIMRQALSIKDLQMPLLLPGVTINTSTADYHPIEQMQMMRFDGTKWQLFGDVLSR
ncbi:MAG: branched-chain amino acid ABC transporter substrate-binding protein [Comamonas sp. SCN 65-56]|nr:MAG: branched-chain amino acid ABC transporter substrate-binding protein [Comamonas sp. SCN 65-56]